MELTILGCGTSVGVPTIGCDCAVCRSEDPRNRRTRTSAVVTLANGARLLIDTSPDLRAQALAHNLRRVDAVLYTHTHADHLHGIDDLRMYNYLMQASVPIYGLKAHLDTIHERFRYIFEETAQIGGGKPQLIECPVEADTEIDIAGARVRPLLVSHGILPCLGWRIGALAYLTDVSAIPDSVFAALTGVEVLVLGALRYRIHSTHFRISEAIAASRRIGAARTLLTHMNHEVDYATLAAELPPGIEPAYDGLRLTVADA